VIPDHFFAPPHPAETGADAGKKNEKDEHLGTRHRLTGICIDGNTKGNRPPVFHDIKDRQDPDNSQRFVSKAKKELELMPMINIYKRLERGYKMV